MKLGFSAFAFVLLSLNVVLPAVAAPIICPNPAMIDRRCDIWDNVCGFPNQEPIERTLMCFDKDQVDPRCHFEAEPCPRPKPAGR